jgi:rubrerythrin
MPPIATVEDFYAHALAIEHEAAERYAELALYFSDRGEDTLAGLASSLASMEREHFDALAAACATLTLPAIDPRRYQWLEADAPESAARELLYRLATPRMLLEIALAAEWRAHEFFAGIARSSPSKEVCELASEMAAEERQHVQWVRDALEYRFAYSPASSPA